MTTQAEQYLADHNIHSIMEYLCSQLVYAKPADPLTFLTNELRLLQTKKVPINSSAPPAAAAKDAAPASSSTTPLTVVPSSSLSLFTSSDFEIMFYLCDPL